MILDQKLRQSPEHRPTNSTVRKPSASKLIISTLTIPTTNRRAERISPDHK